MPEQPTLLGEPHVSKALADPQFFVQLPEFLSLRVKMQAMHADLSAATGCGGCRRRRVVGNLYADFCSIITALTPDGIGRLKQYLGCQALMLNTVDPLTHQVRLRMF